MFSLLSPLSSTFIVFVDYRHHHYYHLYGDDDDDDDKRQREYKTKYQKPSLLNLLNTLAVVAHRRGKYINTWKSMISHGWNLEKKKKWPSIAITRNAANLLVQFAHRFDDRFCEKNTAHVYISFCHAKKKKKKKRKKESSRQVALPGTGKQQFFLVISFKKGSVDVDRHLTVFRIVMLRHRRCMTGNPIKIMNRSPPLTKTSSPNCNTESIVVISNPIKTTTMMTAEHLVYLFIFAAHKKLVLRKKYRPVHIVLRSNKKKKIDNGKYSSSSPLPTMLRLNSMTCMRWVSPKNPVLDRLEYDTTGRARVGTSFDIHHHHHHHVVDCDWVNIIVIIIIILIINWSVPMPILLLQS